MKGRDERHPGLIDSMSYVALVLAAAFFFYYTIGRNADRTAKYFQNLVKKTESQIAKIKPKIAKPVEKSPVKDKDLKIISDVPTFLEMLNKKLTISGLTLDTIKKSNDNDYTYEFITYAPFDRLLHFLYSTEQSNLAIQDLDIHPYSETSQLINIKLRLIKDKMAQDDLKQFHDFQKKFPKSIRDPFQKAVLISTRKQAGEQVINLTWKYKLTGIGFDKERYATIDHNTYYVGDPFHGMRIDRIQSDRVHLISADGKIKYIVAFRYKIPAKRQ